MNHAIRLGQIRSACCSSIRCATISAIAAVLLLFIPSANAQSTGGRIRGTVSDATGSAIAGAVVSLVNTGTNVSREATTSATGEYLFLEVPVGPYQIEINQTGFKKFVRRDIVVDLNAVVTVDIALQVGGSTETVEVTGEPPVIDTTTTQLGAVVNSRDVTELPLNARDTYQLLQLQPGVQSQIGNDLFYGSDKPGVVTVNGGRGRSNNYSVNGGDGNDLFANLPAVEPSPDSIEEFRVITNSFDAEYGRNSGAVVNVVTKSGTNDWHGSAFEFFRNQALNSKGFYDIIKPDFNQNQFGGTLGGPIKKDKTFFFASYEGRRIQKGVSSNPVPVPTAGERAGNFSEDRSGAAAPAFGGTIGTNTYANILNTRPGCAQAISAVGGTAPAVGVGFSSVFPGNVIPTACMDPVAVALVNQFVPTPNYTAGTFVNAPVNRDFGDQFTFKIDHDINKNQKLALYYYFDHDDNTDPFAKFQAAGGNLGNFPGEFNFLTQQLNATHTWTIGSTSVNELRFTYFREGQGKFNTPKVTSDITASCGSSVSQFCFTGTSDAQLVDGNGNALGSNRDYGIHPNLGSTKEGLPFISVNGGFSIGNNFEGQLPQTGNTFQFADNFSKIVGPHSFKFGGDFRYQRFDQLLYYNVNGNFTFTSGSANDVGFNDASGNAIDQYANFLLGLPQTYSQGSAQHEYIRSKAVYLFAQDSWKVKPNVTLNYGIRWELNTPQTDSAEKVQTFRPGENSKIYPCQLSAASIQNFQQNYGIANPDCNNTGVQPTGLVFPGDSGVPKGLTNTYYAGFAPRLGINYSPGWKDGFLGKLAGGPGKSTISAGYGIFYNPIEQLVLEQFSAEPPFGVSNSITNPLFQTPYVDQSGNTYPNPANGILNPPRGSTIDWSTFRPMILYGQFPANLKPQYSDQYNLTLKRELPGNLLFQIGYVGSQGHRLLANYELNAANPASCLGILAIATQNPANVLSSAGGQQASCAQFGEDSSYYIVPGTVIPAGGLYLPYGPNGPQTLPAGTVVGPNGITLVGLRRYSSPNCNPLTAVGCPVDSTPVFSGIFSEDTVAKSNYNSLQVLVEKHYSHGLQFQAAYTYSKSLDNASSFENALVPGNFNATYGPSLYDARHRFVLSYVWELPAPKYEGWKGQLIDGWEWSGIYTFQTGFPIRITSSADNELVDATTIFEAIGEPNLVAPFHTQDPRKNNGYVFNPALFDNNDSVSSPTDPTAVTLGTIGTAPRTICCNPRINNFDTGVFKGFRLSERVHMEFRTEVYNLFNHTQLYDTDGNISDGPTFGKAQKARDPRLFQFALKLLF